MNPRVSVIVPVLNGARRVERCLEALRNQTWPASRLEIIVVDNGSVDDTRARVRDHGAVLMVERSAASPYVARNAGLARARGEVLAFTDADCIPAKDWVEQGLAELERQGADLAGGQVRFSFGEHATAGELLDAVKNLDNERSIAELGAAKTGNLFVTRRVFDALGGFAADRRSGGDVEFTGRASGAGFALVYAPDALVEKRARRAPALARKQYRVGRGELRYWRERGMSEREIVRRIVRGFLPPRPSYVRARLRERAPGNEARWLPVSLTAWWIGGVQSLGRLHEACAQLVRRP